MADQIPDSTKTIPDRLAGAVSEDAIRHLMIRSPLNHAIYQVLRDHSMSNMAFDDDHTIAYPLVDLMSNPAPADIGSGELQMVDLADAIESSVIATRAAPPAMDREAVGFLHQLRCVNMERYQAWASRPLMLCEHCGASEHVESERCAPPFSVQLHSFTKPHASATVENDAGIMFDALELGGEVGELLNVVKKLEREERGWRGSRAQPADFADECADVLICLDKLARRRGVDLIAATIAKFNATSDKVGLPHKLSTFSADAIRQGEGDFSLSPDDDPAFLAAWADMEAKGFAYGNEALESVHLGWLMAKGVLATPASHASDGGKA